MSKKELALIEETYNAALARDLRNNVQGQLWNRIDPDTLFFDYELNGDFVTFGFVNTDYQDGIGIAIKTENHNSMLSIAAHHPQKITWLSREPIQGSAVYSVKGRAAMFYYRYRGGQTVEVPVIAFWDRWNEAKEFLQESILLVQKTDPQKHYPSLGPEWYVATADKVGWFDEIEHANIDKEREKNIKKKQEIHNLMPAEKNKALKAMGAKPKTVDVPRWKNVIGDSTHQIEDKLIAEKYFNR